MDAEKIREAARGGGSPVDMWNALQAYGDRRMWRMVRAKSAATPGNEKHAELAEQVLAELPEISDMQALRMSTLLANHLMGSRTRMMLDARENGATWTDVALAVGLADEHDSAEHIQEAVEIIRTRYAANVDAYERCAPDLYDIARYRAALDDTPSDSPYSQND